MNIGVQMSLSIKKGRRIKSTELEMKIEKSQQTTQKYKGSWDYYQQLYANKIDNLEEMGEFFKKCNFPKLNQEVTENLNRPITSTEIETVIKIFQQTKAQDQMASHLNSTKNLEN